MSLIAHRINGWKKLETLQNAFVACGFFAVLVVVHASFRGALSLQHYATYGLLVALAIVVHSLTLDRSRSNPFSGSSGDHLSIALGQTISVSFMLLIYLAATKDQTISRVFLFSYLFGLFWVLLMSRKLSGRLLGPLFFHERHRCGTIVIGEARRAEEAAAWIESKSDLGLEAVGWLPSKDCAEDSRRLPKLGSIRQLEEVLARTSASVVLVADFMNARVHLPWLRSVCERCGVRLAFSVNFGDSLPGNITCYQEGDVSLITLRDEPLESPFNRALKRMLDILIALPVVLFVLPPLALMVRLIHLVQARGPLLFTQDRVGLKGTPFKIFKFRTMYVDNDNEAVQARRDDDRVFPLGRWLRRLSLDEFPQFINVLQGSMSIVGPRPHMGVHDTNFAKVASPYRLRSFIKPGITGLAQVLGHRGPTHTVDAVMNRTRSDLYYLENWSLKLDVMIIIRTFFEFVRQRGAV